MGRALLTLSTFTSTSTKTVFISSKQRVDLPKILSSACFTILSQYPSHQGGVWNNEVPGDAVVDHMIA